MAFEHIEVTGARENNLKNISLKIPKNQLVVVTGISGSGKSTLAFSTLYAEGQRRYIESLSSYARQFLGRVGKPEVDKIEGLTPAIAIDQKTTSKNPRSTVGTITEIYDYLRLLYARVGKQYCFKCNKPISSMSASDIIEQVLALPEGAKLVLMAPVVTEKKGTFADLIESLRLKGYVRAMIDGVMVRLDEEIELSKTKKHTIKVVVDRVVVKAANKERIGQDVEKALELGFGVMELEVANHQELECEAHYRYSEHMACFDCKLSFEPLEPVSFSFNSPRGACGACDGLGLRYSLDMEKIINPELSIEKGAVRLMHGFNKSYYAKFLNGFCLQNSIDVKKPYGELESFEQKLILYGDGSEVEFLWKRHKIKRQWPGVVEIAYDIVKDERDKNDFMKEKVCDVCEGNRLSQSALHVKINQYGIADILTMPIEECYNYFASNENFAFLTPQQQLIAEPILKEIKERLFFLYDVGLGYLSLGRDARTISGGEAQRIRIASQIGSGLTGVMYVLDEPSIGLHERDTLKLIRTLKSLRDKGNSVIVVEHDKETIRHADYLIDIGPGAGKFGGEVVFAGNQEALKNSNSLTAQYLNNIKQVDHKASRKQKHFISMSNVTLHNLHQLSVKIPLENFVCITGVSGSGKSSLILQTLLPTAKAKLNNAKLPGANGAKIKGLDRLDKVIYLDQSPIGRTPRSNPATYTGIMDEVRKLFAQTQEAELRGYKIGRFSFNVKGGRCEKCQGDGQIKIEMHFLPDVLVECDACKGTRYNAQTLEVLYRGKSIADILAMSVVEALEFFASVPVIASKLETLMAVGLDYITLGQNATTLSGGEAQRIKLSKELSKKDTGKTLYILDEPTTGLHFSDVDRLTGVLHHLAELGNSVVVIEHNLDVIKNADYIIDMGPEGGDKGGQVIAQGTVEEIAKNHKQSGSYTGEFLAQELKETK